MLKKILTVLLLLTVAYPIAVSANLWEYFTEQGVPFPTVLERTPLAEECGINNYQGLYSQNIELLQCIEKVSIFGATVPVTVAVFETSLASKITASSTSMTLVTGTDKAGNALSGYICFTLDEGTSVEEFVCGTTAGTAVSSMIRGISPIDGDTQVFSLKKTHRRGSSVKVTNYPQLAIVSRIVNGDETFPNQLTYASQPAMTDDDDIITKKYVDDSTNQGAATATDSVAGVVYLATRAEIASSTSVSAGEADLALTAQFASSTGETNKAMVVVTHSDGYLDQNFIDLTEAFTFLGNLIFSASTTMADATSTDLGVTGSVTISGGNTSIATTTLTGTITQGAVGTSTLSTTTFDGIPKLPSTAPYMDSHAVRKDYIDGKLGGQLIAVSTSTPVIDENQTAELVIMNGTVLANTLGTDNGLEIKLWLKLEDVVAGGARTFTLYIYYGSVQVAALGFNISGENRDRTGIVHATVIANGATNSQGFTALGTFMDSTGGGILNVLSTGTSTVDSTAEVPITVRAKISASGTTGQLLQLSRGFIKELK